MASEPTDLTLELLRGIRADVSSLRDGLTVVREGLSEVREETHEIRGEIREFRGEIRDFRGEMHEVREDIRGLRRVQDNHTLKADYLDEPAAALRDSTMMALGYSVEAVERKKKMETRISEPAARVDNLEKAK